MFERLGRLAEDLARTAGTSRRGFLGRLGQVALGAAGVLGATTTAARGSGSLVCCKYRLYRHGNYYGNGNPYQYVCQPAGTTCAPTLDESPAQPLRSQTYVSDCTECSH
jgi:hypothetical protein